MLYILGPNNKRCCPQLCEGSRLKKVCGGRRAGARLAKRHLRIAIRKDVAGNHLKEGGEGGDKTSKTNSKDTLRHNGLWTDALNMLQFYMANAIRSVA